jgi:uncharacterized phage protein (TIGR02220 family)
MAKDSYWFRHDSTAGRGTRMRKIAFIYGHWGKGVYWDVIEMLRDQENYLYSCDEFDLKMLADLIGCKDETRFMNWFNDCIKFKLFIVEDGYFYSQVLCDNMKSWEASKNNGSKGGRPTTKKPRINLDDNLTTNLNETIRGEEKREEKNITPTKVDSFDWVVLLEFINSKTKRSFKTINNSIKKSFRARLKDGYSKEDIMKAICNAVEVDYHKENNNQYLTPEFFSRANTLDKYCDKATKKDAPERYVPYTNLYD